MMDYNAYQIALSPCQIGRASQATFTNEKSSVRRCLIPTWCTLQGKIADIIITDSVAWTGARDLEGHVTIAPGGALRLSPAACRCRPAAASPCSPADAFGSTAAACTTLAAKPGPASIYKK
jgi:hypothetical protein